MRTVNQARIRIRTALAKRDLKVNDLARLVGHPRESVSRAINQAKHPLVLAKVKEVLGV